RRVDDREARPLRSLALDFLAELLARICRRGCVSAVFQAGDPLLPCRTVEFERRRDLPLELPTVESRRLLAGERHAAVEPERRQFCHIQKLIVDVIIPSELA